MFIYRLALFLLSPILAVAFLFRLLTGKETRAGLAERFGASNGTTEAIWVHGASIGELTAVRPVVETLLSRDPDAHAIVTMNSYTSRAMVKNWNHPRIRAALAPLDYRWCTSRFLRRWQPTALISLENELWPNRMQLCQDRNIPVMVLGGRMSASAARLWGRFPALTRGLLQGINALAPQDQDSQERFAAIGFAATKTGPVINLKSNVFLQPPDLDALNNIALHFPRNETVVAASTHEGEDETVLDALKIARKECPNLRLILAPRHPNRAKKIQALASKRGLETSLRSHPGATETPDVLIADTLGEMPLWYSAGYVTFIGGTLVDKGGHTPFEPAQFGTAIVHGPSTSNHAKGFAALDQNNGAIAITNAKGLAKAWLQLARNSKPFTDNATKALAALSNDTASMEWIFTTIAMLTKNAAFRGK